MSWAIVICYDHSHSKVVNSHCTDAVPVGKWLCCSYFTAVACVNPIIYSFRCEMQRLKEMVWLCMEVAAVTTDKLQSNTGLRDCLLLCIDEMKSIQG